MKIVSKIYALIKSICWNNEENQMYTYEYFNVFRQQVGYSLGVSSCMMSILKDNDILLQKLHEIDPKLKLQRVSQQVNTIQYFIEHIKRNKARDPQAMKFLTCVC